jgi:homogentisate 1,2-dioxygenase
MPHYISRGSIPQKRHTQFRSEEGKLYSEQLFSTEGFSSNYSLLYHIHPPTKIIKTEEPIDINPKIATENILKHRSFQGFNIAPEADYLQSRKAILVNNDCHISLAAPQKSMSTYFFKNADADEVLFVHEGTGILHSQYGDLAFAYGDYIVIPRGAIYQIEFTTEANRLFIVESFGPIRFPKRYVSKFGQLLENSPYCERDIVTPTFVPAKNEEGEFLIQVKKKGMLYPITYGHHPFDVVASILTFLAFTISSQLQAVFISHHQCIKPSMARILCSVVLCHVYTIIIRKVFQRHTTIAISIVMNCCIM